MSKQVVVELSPTRLEVATLQGGRVRDSRAERLEPADWSESWPGVLTTLDAQLAGLVAKMGVQGAQATVLYAGPTAVNAVFSCPGGAGAGASEQATVLALAGLCTFPLESNPHAMRRLARDPASAASGQGPQGHTLAVADADESTAAVADWIRRAGLRPATLLPLRTPAMVLSVRAAMDGKPGDGPRAVLWMGEHGSILAAGHGGSLLFVRALGLGTEDLVEALGRPIRVRSEEGRTVTLNRAEARELLESSGVPLASDLVDPDRGIDGAGILPLIQPVLQRIGIETKQSLRFGLSEEDRAKVRLTILGPGGCINRLGDMLGRQCNAKYEPQPGQKPDARPDTKTDARPDASSRPQRLGNIGALGLAGSLKVNLTPRSVERAQSMRRLRAGLWTGTAASLLLIGAEWLVTGKQLEISRADLATIKAAADERNARTEAQDRAIAARTRAAGLEQRVWKELGEPADWAAILSLLGEATSPKVRLTIIELGADRTGPHCRVSGYMLAGAGSDPAAVITSYIDELSGKPIVRSVRLGPTQRAEFNGGQGQRFELGVNLVGLPPLSLSMRSDGKPPPIGGGGGGAP